MGEYPLEMLEDHVRLSDWVVELSQRYGDRILIKVIDPQSGLGFFKALRHWVRSYPTFIVNGRKRLTGWDKAALDAILQEEMGAMEAAAA